MTYPLTKSIPESQRERWEHTPIPSFAGGININERAELIKPNEVVEAVAMRVQQGELIKDTGYILLGNSGVDSALDSPIRRTIQFTHTDNTVELVGITKGSVYTFNTAQLEWDYVPSATTSVLTAGAAASATTLAMVSTGFTGGKAIGIRLTNGKQYRTTVATVPDGVSITIPAPGLPSGASNGAAVVLAVALSGSDNLAVEAVNVQDSNAIAFTNGVDYVKYYNGTVCADIPGLTTTTCRSLRVYNGALFLFNTIEGGVAYKFRVRRSEIGDHTTWSGGTAGYDDLLDTTGEVMNGDILGPYLIVYKTKVIYRVYFVGQAGKMYQFDPMVQGAGADGLAAVDGLINMGPFHVFVGSTNVYMYYGDIALTPIADNVFYMFSAASGDFNSNYLYRLFAIYVDGLRECWFVYPSSGSQWPDTILKYDMFHKAWVKRTLSNAVTSAGLYNTTNTPTWSSMTGAWSDQVNSWNSRALAGTNIEVVLLTGASVNVAWQYNYSATTDIGTSFAGYVVTRDFVWTGGVLRTDRLDLFIQGIAISIQYSTDQGKTWNLWEIITVGSEARVSSYKQVVCNTIRFKVYCIDPNFRIRWMNLIWRPESSK